MLRLIDVVLNVLFGILMVTSIENQMHVNLVKTSHLDEMSKDASGYIMIGLTDTDSFLFDFGKQAFSISELEEIKLRVKKDKEKIDANNRSAGVKLDRQALPQMRIVVDSLASCGNVALLMGISRDLKIPCGVVTVVDPTGKKRKPHE